MKRAIKFERFHKLTIVTFKKEEVEGVHKEVRTKKPYSVKLKNSAERHMTLNKHRLKRIKVDDLEAAKIRIPGKEEPK